MNSAARQHLLNDLAGRPYAAGADGLAAFDCYGLTRYLQHAIFGRQMPPFFMPRHAGRLAIATAIATHPERDRWQAAMRPVDGAIAIMSRQSCGFHLGTFLDIDGGVIVHALEAPGVAIDAPYRLQSPGGGGWRIAWNVPVQDVASREAA